MIIRERSPAPLAGPGRLTFWKKLAPKPANGSGPGLATAKVAARYMWLGRAAAESRRLYCVHTKARWAGM